MNIEQLTKAQIILLTLLVSFVTSIATGIITVTLLDQAPPAIQQTINKVVERTIERVVPDESLRAGIVTEEVTVVVREDDLITESIENNRKSLVEISRDALNEEGEKVRVTVGSGIVMTPDGIIATDSSVILEGAPYIIKVGGKEYPAVVLAQDEDSGTALLGISNSSSSGDSGKSISLTPILFTRTANLKLGQTVISLSGSSDIRVATGVISGLRSKKISVKTAEASEPQTRSVLATIETTIAGPVDIGSPVINIFGEVLGLNLTGSRNHAGRYMPIEDVLLLLDSLSDNTENKG